MDSIELFEICQNAMNEIWAPQFERDKKGVGRGDVAVLIVNIEQQQRRDLQKSTVNIIAYMQ